MPPRSQVREKTVSLSLERLGKNLFPEDNSWLILVSPEVHVREAL